MNTPSLKHMTRAHVLQCVVTGDYATLSEAERKELFIQEVNKHDLTHEYSDDGAVWRAGSQHLSMIKMMAHHLPQEFVRSTWNAMVDKSLVASEAPNWYWKG